MLYKLLRPVLFRLDAEEAHGLTMKIVEAMHRSGLGVLAFHQRPSRPTTLLGLEFSNPVGLAAGLDKDGAHIDALGSLGFGFLEVGTVTPRPQDGNPRPRLFRIAEARAIINRMGFNNLGVDNLVRNVERCSYRGILGINIGKNFDTPNERAVDDYLHCLRRVYPVASYVTVNISSPNTLGLRQLQQPDTLGGLLGRLKEEQMSLGAKHARHVPLLVKIAPDLAPQEIDDMAAVMLRNQIEGVIATNTTLARDGVEGLTDEKGGLSGAPLRDRATAVVHRLSTAMEKRVPIIASGGILSGSDARQKIDAGASLVQIYSGLVYRGPALIGEIAGALE
jgi:dihydroorotate dehydrogenase